MVTVTYEPQPRSHRTILRPPMTTSSREASVDSMLSIEEGVVSGNGRRTEDRVLSDGPKVQPRYGDNSKGKKTQTKTEKIVAVRPQRRSRLSRAVPVAGVAVHVAVPVVVQDLRSLRLRPLRTQVSLTTVTL